MRPILTRLAATALGSCLLFWGATATAAEVFLGVYAHDVDDGISIGHSPESGQQIIGGYRTGRVDRLAGLGRPQLHVLGAVNTHGGVNYAAAGLSWRLGLTGRLYLQPGLGLAVHSGRVNLPSPYDPGLTLEERERRARAFQEHLDLGSRLLFEPELSLGWRVSDRLALELSWIHLSHAQLAGRQNPGLGDAGIRAVYRLGR